MNLIVYRPSAFGTNLAADSGNLKMENNERTDCRNRNHDAVTDADFLYGSGSSRQKRNAAGARQENAPV